METLRDVPFVVDLGIKAADGGVIELANGDLLIEGWGANYDLDREDEAFEEGAFGKALSKFLAGNAPLCYHHKYDTIIGRVADAFPVPGKGIWVKAIVDFQPEGSPWRHIYEGIKKGRINQYSCGGIFKRKMTKSGPRIFDVDLLEWSATPIPVGRGTTFSVVAGKALEAPYEGKAELDEDEQKVAEAAAARELGDHDKEVPETGTPAKPAPEREEEEEAQREVAEEETDEDREAREKAEAEAAAAVEAEAKKVDGESIAPGSITTEHLSEELRSRFSELKLEPETPEGPSVEELAAALDKLGESLNAVATRVGIKVEDDKPQVQKPEEVTPTTGPVVFN